MQLTRCYNNTSRFRQSSNLHEKYNFQHVNFRIWVQCFNSSSFKNCFLFYTRGNVWAQTKHKRRENWRNIKRRDKATGPCDKAEETIYLKRKKKSTRILHTFTPMTTAQWPFGIVGTTLLMLCWKCIVKSNYAQGSWFYTWQIHFSSILPNPALFFVP